MEFRELKCLAIVAGSCSGNGSKTAYKFPKRGLAFMTKTSHFRTCRWLGRNSLEGWANIKLLIVAILAPCSKQGLWAPVAIGGSRMRPARRVGGPGGHGDANSGLLSHASDFCMLFVAGTCKVLRLSLSHLPWRQEARLRCLLGTVCCSHGAADAR